MCLLRARLTASGVRVNICDYIFKCFSKFFLETVSIASQQFYPLPVIEMHLLECPTVGTHVVRNMYYTFGLYSNFDEITCFLYLRGELALIFLDVVTD